MTTLTHATEQYEEGNDDSSGSVEGAIARSLFRTETDDEEDDTDNVNSCSPPLSTAMFVERHVMDICLCERQMGSSIAERLWPAAQYLAQFVMDVQDGSAWQQKEMSDYDNCDARALGEGKFISYYRTGCRSGLDGDTACNAIRYTSPPYRPPRGYAALEAQHSTKSKEISCRTRCSTSESVSMGE